MRPRFNFPYYLVNARKDPYFPKHHFITQSYGRSRPDQICATCFCDIDEIMWHITFYQDYGPYYDYLHEKMGYPFPLELEVCAICAYELSDDQHMCDCKDPNSLYPESYINCLELQVEQMSIPRQYNRYLIDHAAEWDRH